MILIKRDGYVIWPIYFDASVSRSKCRRVPLNLAVKNPTAEQIASAARKLGWKVEIESGSHPAFWWKRTGRIIVKPNGDLKKSEVLRQLAYALKSVQR